MQQMQRARTSDHDGALRDEPAEGRLEARFAHPQAERELPCGEPSGTGETDPVAERCRDIGPRPRQRREALRLPPHHPRRLGIEHVATSHRRRRRGPPQDSPVPRTREDGVGEAHDDAPRPPRADLWRRRPLDPGHPPRREQVEPHPIPLGDPGSVSQDPDVESEAERRPPLVGVEQLLAAGEVRRPSRR